MQSSPYLIYLGVAFKIDLCKCTEYIEQDSLKADKSVKEFVLFYMQYLHTLFQLFNSKLNES